MTGLNPKVNVQGLEDVTNLTDKTLTSAAFVYAQAYIHAHYNFASLKEQYISVIIRTFHSGVALKTSVLRMNECQIKKCSAKKT